MDLEPMNEELLDEFFAEAQLQVESMENSILTLEKKPGDKASLQELFRASHTLKGASAAVQMSEIADFTHELEDLLDTLRNGDALIRIKTIDILLSAVDVITLMLKDRLEGRICRKDFSRITGDLKNLKQNESLGNTSTLNYHPEIRVEQIRFEKLMNLLDDVLGCRMDFDQSKKLFSNALQNLRTREKNHRNELQNQLDKKQKRNTKKLEKSHSDLKKLESRFENSFAQYRYSSAKLEQGIDQIHAALLQIRRVSLEKIFRHFPRLVRDLSRILHKEVDLIIQGGEIEVERSLSDDLLDPLIHCVRNSIDHGIEYPHLRVKAAKNRRGQLSIKASEEGQMIRIEISDDGSGIDIGKIKEIAVDSGSILPESSFSEEDAYTHMFKPGFSTAPEVSSISGRGVGLDVLQKRLEKLNGSVSVWSEQGKGTKFTLSLPLF